MHPAAGCDGDGGGGGRGSHQRSSARLSAHTLGSPGWSDLRIKY